jgi:hypothetical protein
MTRRRRSEEPSHAAPGQATVTKQRLLEQARFAAVGAALAILFLLFIHNPSASGGSGGQLQRGYLSLVGILSAFVLSFRARVRDKLIGIVVSSSVLGLAAFARIRALSFVEANFSSVLAEMYDDISAILLLALALGLFVLWAQWVSEGGPAKWMRGLVCLGLILGGVAAWPVLQAHFGQSYCGSVNAWSAQLTFGQRGHAALVPQADPRADVVLGLTVDGINGRWKLEGSLRRQAYLPLVLLGSILLTTATPHRRKVLLLSVGLGAAFASGLWGFWMLSVYSFSHTIPGVLQLSPFFMRLLELGLRTFVQPDIVWKVGPVLFGLLLIFVDRAQQEWQRVLVRLPEVETRPRRG